MPPIQSRIFDQKKYSILVAQGVKYKCGTLQRFKMQRHQYSSTPRSHNRAKEHLEEVVFSALLCWNPMLWSLDPGEPSVHQKDLTGKIDCN